MITTFDRYKLIYSILIIILSLVVIRYNTLTSVNSRRYNASGAETRSLPFNPHKVHNQYKKLDYNTQYRGGKWKNSTPGEDGTVVGDKKPFQSDSHLLSRVYSDLGITIDHDKLVKNVLKSPFFQFSGGIYGNG